MPSRWKDYLLGVGVGLAIVLVLSLLGWVAEAYAGTTSQTAFSRCGETHLTVRNNTEHSVHVIMFGRYGYLEAQESAVFWTDKEVTVDRVTRRHGWQTYHTSITSAFTTEERECTLEWSTL